MLRHLPDWVLPLRRYAKELHKEEFDLFVGHYRDTRDRLRAGVAKVLLNIYHIQTMYS